MDVKVGFSETSLIGEPFEVVLGSRVASFWGLYKHQCEPDNRFPLIEHSQQPFHKMTRFRVEPR